MDVMLDYREVTRIRFSAQVWNEAHRAQLRIRYIAQSILTGVIDNPELPTYTQACDIIAWADEARPYAATLLPTSNRHLHTWSERIRRYLDALR